MKNLHHERSSILGLLMACAMAIAAAIFTRNIPMAIAAGVVTLACGYTIFRIIQSSREEEENLITLGKLLSLKRQETMIKFPLPVMVCSENHRLLWYNERAKKMIFEGESVFSEKVTELFPSLRFGEECPEQGYHVEYNKKMFSAFVVETTENDTPFYLIYMIDDTRLKKLAREYYFSKPAVFLILVDNYEELWQNARENERGQIMLRIEKLIENFALSNNGLLRRVERDKYLVVLEERYMKKILDDRFMILDDVRRIVTSDKMQATLSIGVGREARTLAQGEEMARQALDMALGRGGDQVAVKSKSGYEFFGGMSKGVEKRTKVKTRIVATALAKLIQGCDNVLVMGHRFGDLDSLGSSIGIYSAVRRMGKPVHIVLNEERNLAKPLYKKFTDNGYQSIFVDPSRAEEMIGVNTLLIILDTHVPHILESQEVYRACRTVVVIDHHRKMVDYIDNAVIFYHEPYASSASEMVTELIQYFGDNHKLASLEAEALLAGIMLDTKNFIIKTGVRTFEAAAYLRKLGADTTEVRRLFSSTMETYQRKTRLVSSAEVYKRCAIASTQGGEDIKLVAPQAADELLNISGVDASFVMFEYNGEVDFCARSMGEMNVQIIMEQLGGGGHQTMAGAQIPGMQLEDARQKLLEAIDRYEKMQ